MRWEACLWTIIVLSVIIFIVLAITVTPATTEIVHSNVVVESRTDPLDCTVGETFDTGLSSCAPITKVPLPIIEELFDQSVGPCESFFKHTCGGWIANHTNEDRSFSYVYKKNRKIVYDIISNPTSGPIYTFYRSCLDTLVNGEHRLETTIEERHVAEQTVDRLFSHEDLPVIWARLAKYGYTSPFSLSIESHPTEPRMIPLIRATPFYTVDFNLLDSLTDIALMEATIEQLSSFQTIVVSQSNSFEEYVKNEFPADVRPFTNLNFWKEYLTELSGSAFEHEILLAEDAWIPEEDFYFLTQLFERLHEVTIEQWRVYVKYSVRYNTRQFMPAVSSDSYFRMHDMLHHRLRKQEHQLNRREEFSRGHCLALTNNLLPGLVAQHYLGQMDRPESTRQIVTIMAENIRNEYAALLESTHWFNATTKQLAIEKIRAITVRAIHPTTWEIEPFHARITLKKYLHNLNMIRQYRVQRNLQLWSMFYTKEHEKNRDAVQRFGAPLTTVNAYYSPVTNTITIFAGIVTEPFFNIYFDPVAMYAGLGMIIGHELSHAMDNSGRMFDAEGSLKEWWDPRDAAAFDEKAQCVVDEYGPPKGCENMNYGQQTLGEDIADITGITIALNAYIKENGPVSAEKIRQFFTVFAQLWAESFDLEHICERVEDDVHAVASFRVDKTFRQIQAAHTAFGCKPGDPMVNSNKCVIYG